MAMMMDGKPKRGSRISGMCDLVRLLALVGLLQFAGAASVAADSGAVAALERVHADIIEDYPDVTHISATAIDDLAPEDVLFFDVREDDEFAVSRIEGAVRVEPGTDAEDFLRAHGDAIAGKAVVLYCSVGVRSSRLAERLLALGEDAGPVALYNLEGGLFNWHNAGKPVVDGEGDTPAIHPYNRRWGRLIARQDDIRMTPSPR